MTRVQRRIAAVVDVGGVKVGGSHPIVVQSMTNTDTADITSTVNQVMELARAGSELVRVTVNTEEAAAAVPRIVDALDKFGVRVPIVGDFHYNGHILLRKYPECARALAKYRINPGNVNIGKRHDDNFRTMIEVAIEYDRPVRIGVNWGSLDQALLTRLMDENAVSEQPLDATEVTMRALVWSLLTRRDVIVVSTVSCIYGLGSAEEYLNRMVHVEVGNDFDRDSLLRKLVQVQYTRNDLASTRGTFRVRGDTLEVFPVYQEHAIRVEFFGDEIERLMTLHPAHGRGAQRGEGALHRGRHALRDRPGADGAVHPEHRGRAGADDSPSSSATANCSKRSDCGCARHTTSR